MENIPRGELGKSLKSFMGYLEGTQRSGHTKASYRLDLLDFFRFLEKEGFDLEKTRLAQIESREIEAYHAGLRKDAQKANTRRRKLMTLRKWLQYLRKRKKIATDLGRILPTPDKSERVPAIVPRERVLTHIAEMGVTTDLELRNKVLLWLLLETGAAVSEVAALRSDQVERVAKTRLKVEFTGKKPRIREITGDAELLDGVERLRADAGDTGALFCGFNRHGKLRAAGVTPRGVEMLVHGLGKTWGLDLTPRLLRHSVVVAWYRDGVLPDEIQARLGLSTGYSMRLYEPHFKAIRDAADAAQPSQA